MLSNTQSVRDIEGYVIDPGDWNRELAQQLASEENLELSEDYWQIFEFMRGYWLEHRVSPDVRHVIEYLASEQGYEKKKPRNTSSIYFPTAT
jgi:tRNA 2-thiouridine synthesizing protein E